MMMMMMMMALTTTTTTTTTMTIVDIPTSTNHISVFRGEKICWPHPGKVPMLIQPFFNLVVRRRNFWCNLRVCDTLDLPPKFIRCSAQFGRLSVNPIWAH